MHPPFAFKVMCMKKQDAELRQQEMLEKPVERLIVRMGLPTMASMLLSSLYNLVDTYFVSQINTSASAAAHSTHAASITSSSRFGTVRVRRSRTAAQ